MKSIVRRGPGAPIPVPCAEPRKAMMAVGKADTKPCCLPLGLHNCQAKDVSDPIFGRVMNDAIGITIDTGSKTTRAAGSRLSSMTYHASITAASSMHAIASMSARSRIYYQPARDIKERRGNSHNLLLSLAVQR
ncbi:hypothetical protein LshimejAT787_2300210 [Lyophyllum shimeji]|uniref:Uncharacterized protein n=1 Tax=Lyophyllum shimeji TaxID=47721 RepID=A0A9P3UWU1_LYOSH|nr:hypothetical protein LshimejAT787_2300210 [Lyophyllum shimeji]